MLINEETIQSKIYIIRGQKVMLDFELAEIYGYTTTKFNQQVKNNIEKFDEDFMFTLTKDEFSNLMSKNLTSSWGGRRKIPRVFTEQGIYMLMTVLKGELATKQSKALIRTFKQMKDYIIENQGLLNQRDFLQLSLVVAEHGRDIDVIKSSLGTIDKEVADVVDYLGHVVTKSELSGFMNIFDPPEFRSHYRENSIAIKGKAVYHMEKSKKYIWEKISMNKDTLKIIIFDMDGVILDSEPLHENARQMMYRNFGIVPDESFPNPVGKSSSGFWRTVSGLCGIERDAYELEAEQYHLVAMQIKENHVPVSDGLMDVLNWAKENGVKIGLASSSTRVLVDNTLNFLGIQEYFDYTVSGDEIAHKKPAPDPYLKVLEMAGMTPEQAVAVEDSHSGVQAAKNAGIFCFGYDNPTSGDQDLSNADQVILKVGEIVDILK